MEQGIDYIVCKNNEEILCSDRLRKAFTKKGVNLCELNDITIRTKSKDGTPLEMYTSKARYFLYAIENEAKDDWCRAYLVDMQKTKEHFLNNDFSCKEIQNDDGNYFAPIAVPELQSYGLILKKYPPEEPKELCDWC